MTAKASKSWSLWGVRATVVVTEPDLLDSAWHLVRGHLAVADLAVSSTRTDSEIAALNRSGGRPVSVSATLAQQVRHALEAAELTDGLLDPTAGADRPYAWRSVAVHGTEITLPTAVTLDLDATMRSATADHCAEAVAALLGCGVLVSLGGDVATAGPEPASGWQIKVEDLPGEPSCQVSIPSGSGLSTASTVSPLHPDPADPPRWRTVSVVAGSACNAAAVSKAALRLGDAALEWLDRLRLPARLVDRDARVTLLGGWP
ncbi:FAD:protein FMN transferase [Rhodococcus spelaei]|uniref:FAD:protein FMN transferase n=1 Tax=Rhodococcus spelaei TaxID=2546320 RepID=A0A541BNM6_9NOCA|nr:FAD:protein FMN transferase [Rhodococcus spelaei]TQF73923.1 FAD:protein FMN transferase [Rhodococcus spelaei]